jgi:adenylate cyclase
MKNAGRKGPTGPDAQRGRRFAAPALVLAAGIMGGLVSVTPPGFALEERYGLDALFQWRGPRPAPPEVVIVSLDQSSARRLGLPNEPRKWPRDLHARLVRNLGLAGAAVIGFDMTFEEARDVAHDERFAQAIRQAGNVVLFARLARETTPLVDRRGRPQGALESERLVPPLRPLADAAAATAPFPLPKVPVKVSQFWLFKDGLAQSATLPMVAFQWSLLGSYDTFLRLLRAAGADTEALPADAQGLRQARNLPQVMERLRALLRQPPIAARVEGLLAADTTMAPVVRQRLASLVHAYRDAGSRFLNFYGPPGAVTTLPYYDVWRAAPGGDVMAVDLRGKIVLVGFAEHLQPEQKDNFYTTYSQEDSGLDISGVEIAATALANLVDDTPVRPLGFAAQFALVTGWGMLLATLALVWRPGRGWFPVALAVVVYVAVALRLFSADALWLPLVVPLGVQGTAILFGALWWHNRLLAQERTRIRQAFRNYLPERALQSLARDMTAASGGELMYGVCLATDAARYTTLAERTAPDELARLMNRYYDTVFQPVRTHGGFVSDVVGDAMLAIWAQVQPDAAQRTRACRAALEVSDASARFRESLGSAGFSTRIGLHFGQIMLGSIGAGDHYEYRAVGDIVNTASRLQALNKVLGTQVLASQDTVTGLMEFRVRPLGSFRLPGKTQPTAVVELRGFTRHTTPVEEAFLREFTLALEEFAARRYAVAHNHFVRLLGLEPQDGPARYYQSLCARYLVEPPEEEWDGVVTVSDRHHES